MTGGLVALGVEQFIHGLIEMGTESSRAAKRLGITTEQFEQWGFAANQSGVDTEALSSGMKFLARNLYEANTAGGASAELFAKLGIHTKDAAGQSVDLNTALEASVDAFSKVKNPTDQVGMAIKLFGRGGLEMIPILKQGSEGLAALRVKFIELGGGVSEGAVEAAKKAKLSLKDFNFSLLSLKSLIAVEILPVVTTLVNAGTKMAVSFFGMAKNSEFFRAALIALGVTAATILGGLSVSFLLPKLAILALVAVVDDLLVLFDGGQSVIGDFIDSMAGVGASKTVVVELKDTWEALGRAVSFVVDQFKALPTFLNKDIGEALDFLAGDARHAMGLHGKNAAGITGDRENAGGSAGFGSVVTDRTGAKTYLSPDRVADGETGSRRAGSGFMSDISRFGGETAGQGSSRILDAGGLPAYLQRPGVVQAKPSDQGTGKMLQQTNTITIPITTTGDPKQIAEIAKEQVGRELDTRIRAANVALTEGAK